MRASTLLVLGALALTSCDDAKPAAPAAPPKGGRSDAVVASSAKPAATPVATVAPKVATPRKLCASRVDLATPKGSLSMRAAPGAASLPSEPAFGTGKWLWVNLWAAWCAPCKEEMPRIAAFRDKLRASGVLVDVAFISIDDDERQLERFLEAQPASGVRASYWLPEGNARSTFLGSLQRSSGVELPVHAFVAPSGRTQCVVDGAIEESDYAAIASLMGR